MAACVTASQCKKERFCGARSGSLAPRVSTEFQRVGLAAAAAFALAPPEGSAAGFVSVLLKRLADCLCHEHCHERATTSTS